jgi:hypothetical protein
MDAIIAVAVLGTLVSRVRLGGKPLAAHNETMNVLIAGFQHETNTLEARAPGPMSADPSDLPWTRLAASARVPD